MPLRPHLSSRPARQYNVTICIAPPHTPRPACLNTAYHPRYHLGPQNPSHRTFHASASLHDDAKSHYETLDISQTATTAEIKRQYFTLSKKYHPDRNPDDPNASTRFVEISEAYHVLSVPDKRAAYDSQMHQHSSSGGVWGRRGGYAPAHGSYSSAQQNTSWAGSRPATGLNKKRGTFRGPPPSFYKSGGYGRHGAKRAEYAHHNPHTGSSGGHEAPPENYGEFGRGMGPGQEGRGNEVPHFDDRRHKEMHDNVYEHIYAKRRRMREEMDRADLDVHGPIWRFLLVSATLTAIGFTAKFLGDKIGAEGGRHQEVERKRKNSAS